MKALIPTVYTENKRSKTARKYRTHCKNCKLSIFMDEPAVWQSGPDIGLVHEGCTE